MKKKIISFMFALCLVIPCVFIFTACGGDKHEHTYGKWNEEIAATCTTAGTKGHYHCEGCGKDFDENYKELSSLTISATGHTYSDDWSSDATNHWHAATCEHTTEKKDEEAHTFNYKGVCTTCDYDSCSTLSLGYVFDDDNSKGTSTAVVNTKWYTKVSLISGTAYMARCTNKNQYEIKICDKDGNELYKFSSTSNNFYKFSATYTGDYYISISKTVSGDYKPIFFIASVQNMTSPFDNENANNSATYAAKEFKVFSFTIAKKCSIKFNGAFGANDFMKIVASDMKTMRNTSWDGENYFQVIEDLPAGTYYFVDNKEIADTTVNYYLVCGHDFGDDYVCDVCGYTCTHSTTNAYDICDTCGHFLGHTDVVANGDSVEVITDDDGNAYYKFTLAIGTYRIIEDLGDDASVYNFYLYAEDADDDEYTEITPSTTQINIDEEGVYYLVIEEDPEGDYGNGGHSFQLLRDISSDLLGVNLAYIDTTWADGKTYYYCINITTAGLYQLYTDGGDGTVSILGQTLIDNSYYDLAVGLYIVKLEVEGNSSNGLEIDSLYQFPLTPATGILENTGYTQDYYGGNTYHLKATISTTGLYQLTTSNSNLEVQFFSCKISVTENYYFLKTGDYILVASSGQENVNAGWIKLTLKPLTNITTNLLSDSGYIADYNETGVTEYALFTITTEGFYKLTDDDWVSTSIFGMTEATNGYYLQAGTYLLEIYVNSAEDGQFVKLQQITTIAITVGASATNYNVPANSLVIFKLENLEADTEYEWTGDFCCNSTVGESQFYGNDFGYEIDDEAIEQSGFTTNEAGTYYFIVVTGSSAKSSTFGVSKA